MTDYQPIACGLHDRYQLAVMHRERLRIDGVLGGEEVRGVEGQVVDVFTRAGAEYLALRDEQGERLEFRLDRLRRVERADGRGRLS